MPVHRRACMILPYNYIINGGVKSQYDCTTFAATELAQTRQRKCANEIELYLHCQENVTCFGATCMHLNGKIPLFGANQASSIQIQAACPPKPRPARGFCLLKGKSYLVLALLSAAAMGSFWVLRLLMFECIKSFAVPC